MPLARHVALACFRCLLRIIKSIVDAKLTAVSLSFAECSAGGSGQVKMTAKSWSAVAGISSAAAAVFALIITLQERHTPYKTALYSARWSTIEEYARASANLSTALNLAAIAVPDEVGSPVTLAKMSDKQMLAAAKAARPAITAWGEYIAASSSTGAPWSIPTNRVMSRAESDGRRAYECYRQIEAKVEGDVIPPGWSDLFKKTAAAPCKN